jgi:predicted phosphodiesterase
MGRIESATGIVAKEYCEKYPNSSTGTIVNLIKSKYPNFDKENIRCRVRYYRGALGDKARKNAKFKNFNLPTSSAHSFEPFHLSQSRTLILSDLHFPYQHNEAISLAMNYGLEKDANCILINGDLIDFANISRHDRDIRNRSTVYEIESVRMFLEILRETFPKARIIFKYGNHDERWDKWLYINAPEFFELDALQLESVLRLNDLNIEVVKDKRPIKIGKLTVLHGHEIVGGSGGVNPARSMFMKTFDNVLVGHFHKTSTNTETSLSGDVIATHSVGCLCGLTPSYMPINRFNLGFAYCELQIKTGEYHLENLKIIKGKIY